MAFSALDTSQNSRNLIPCMGEKGITAVGRYYTKRRTNTKTADEARRLSDAGITIWTVYQNRHRELVDFSSAKGKQEAEDALDYARNVINQPQAPPSIFRRISMPARPPSTMPFARISRPSLLLLRRQVIPIASEFIVQAQCAKVYLTLASSN